MFLLLEILGFLLHGLLELFEVIVVHRLVQLPDLGKTLLLFFQLGIHLVLELFFYFFVKRDGFDFFLGGDFFLYNIFFTALLLHFDLDDLLDGFDALFVRRKQVASGLFKLLDLINHVIIIFKRIVIAF